MIRLVNFTPINNSQHLYSIRKSNGMDVFDWNDTIVALATPPGVGALGIIRLSGQTAIRIADELFVSKDLQAARSHTLHVGWLVHNNNRLDEVVVSLFKSPRSYTGEDVVEISCHG